MRKILATDTAVTATRIAAGVFGFALLLLGVAMLIIPEVVATLMVSLSTTGAGVNSLRADLGALFLAMGAFALVGVFSRHRWLLLIPIVFLTLVIAGRLVGAAVDEFPMATTGPLVGERVLLLVLTLALVSYAGSPKAAPRPRALDVVGSRGFWIPAAVGALLLGGAHPEMLAVLNRAAVAAGQDVAAAVATDILTYQTFPEEATRIARDADVSLLGMTHIIPPLPASILVPAFLGDSRRIDDGPIRVGYDGMLFSMLPSATAIRKTWLLKELYVIVCRREKMIPIHDRQPHSRSLGLTHVLYRCEWLPEFLQPQNMRSGGSTTVLQRHRDAYR